MVGAPCTTTMRLTTVLSTSKAVGHVTLEMPEAGVLNCRTQPPVGHALTTASVNLILPSAVYWRRL